MFALETIGRHVYNKRSTRDSRAEFEAVRRNRLATIRKGKQAVGEPLHSGERAHKRKLTEAQLRYNATR